MDERFWLPIISSRRNDIWARTLRLGLAFLSVGYGCAVRLRNAAYASRIFRTEAAPLPIISVGNLTTGGTGKSPLVIWIAAHLRARDWRVCVLSRGYKGATGINDESLELAERQPDVPQFLDPDRVRSARLASEELEMQVALLDDGFQHRRLARDFDVVLLDATQPFGFNWLLPRGLMREPKRSLRRADWILITRSNGVEPEQLQQLVAELERVAPAVPRSLVDFVPGSLLRADGVKEPLARAADQAVFAFCGLGNPRAFFQSVEQIAGRLVGQFAWPDHHAYSPSDLEEMSRQAGQAQANLLICSHKDLVKIGRNRLGPIPLLAMVSEVRFRSGETEFLKQLDSVLRPY